MKLFNSITKSLLIGAALLGSGTVSAIDLRVGYCDGLIDNTGLSKVGKAEVSAAIIMNPEDLAAFAGSEIVGIRVGFGALAEISDLYGWIAPSLDGERTMQVSIPTTTPGWNEARFSEPMLLDVSKPLVIGYTFNQPRSARIISVAGQDLEDGCWVAKNGTWENLSNKYEGSISVELIVSSESFPETDLALHKMSAEPIIFYGDSLAVTGFVQNTSVKDVEAYTIKVSVGEQEAVSVVREKLIPYQSRDTFEVRIQTANFEDALAIPFKVECFAEGDGVADNNSLQSIYSTYTETVQRRILFEEFTTEKCGNCPRAIEGLAECMANGYEEKTVLIAHHVGYSTDWLTVQEDKTFLWLYASDSGTFAPAGTIDRTWEGNSNYPGPVSSIGYAPSIYPRLDKALSYPAFVTVSPTATIDESREMKVTVEMECFPIFKYLVAQPRLSVILTEDGIRHHSQAGYDVNKEFYHSHVYRKSLNEDIWGDQIVWDGNTAKMEFTYQVPEDFVIENLNVVAFVNNYNPADYNDNKVYNTDDCHVVDVTGITSVADDAVFEKFYTLDGREISSPSKGIYVIRSISADGSVKSRTVCY